MEGTCSERLLSASSDEMECYLYPKRVKIESNQKSTEKEEQQKLEQNMHSLNRYQMSPQEPIYLSERQKSWALEMQSCDTGGKASTREFFHFQTCSNERSPCRVSHNKVPTEKCSPENEDQATTEDDMPSDVRGQPPESESLGVWSAANTCDNLQVLNPSQVQQNSSIEQNAKRNGDNELKKISSFTPLNGDLFQMELLSHKSVSEKKWKQYQLLQVPFLCGTNSVFSHTEHEKNNFLKKVCSMEDKICSSSDKETTAERDNKEKNNSSYIIPTLKTFKSMQPLEIPNFQLPSISNKINTKMPSVNLKKRDWRNFKGQPPLTQSKQIHGVQNRSEIGKQKLQNAKSSVTASTVGSQFKEKNCSSISQKEHSTSAEIGKVPVTYFRDKNTDVACNQILAENYFKGETLENSDGDGDQKSRICIYISTKTVQNEKCVSCSDLLKRMGRKSSNENAKSFSLQTSFPVITETLEKNQLALHSGVQSASSESGLYEAEPKASTKAILDFKRFLTENVIFENSCPHIIVQKFPNKKVSCNRFRGKEMFNLKFSFQNMFGWVRTWTESLPKGMPTCQGDSMTHQFHFCETLNEQCDGQELVKSNIKSSYNNKICIFVLTIISKHLKVEPLKKIFTSFFSSKNILLPTRGVENHPLSGRKQVWLNSCPGNPLRQNTEFHKKHETSLGFLSSTFVESIGFELRNRCQRRHFSRSLGEEESTFIKRGALFHSQKSGLCKGRHVRKHHLFPREHNGFSSYLRSVSCKNSMKKQILVAKCLILLQGTFDCSSLEKMHCCNITKIQDLIGANLRFWSYFLGHSQLKLEKVNNSKCTNQGTSVTTVKLEKKKPSKMFNSSFNREGFKAFPVVLCENKTHETTGCRNCIKPTNEFINEVTYTTKKYLGTGHYADADRKECVKSKELQINSDHFFSANFFSVFDTYEKIPLTADSEDFDHIPVVNQDNSVKKKLSEENAVPSSKKVHGFPAKSSDVLILPGQSKTGVEKCKSLLLQDSQTNQPECCKKIDTYSPHLVNKGKLEDQNTCLNFENVFLGSSGVCQSVALPLDSRALVIRGGAVGEDGHCGSPSSADKQKQSEQVPAAVEYPSAGSPAGADTSVQLQAQESLWFALQGHTQTKESVGSEPATLKQHFEYVKDQEEISDEQMHVTNESQCETVMNDLIMSYSEEESKTFIAAEEKLKMHLSGMNNGCLEDVEEKYLPLENKITYEFELKRKFDLVLEELHMFHEISKGNENNLSSLETKSQKNYCELNNSEGTDENVTSVSQKKICISSPICGTTEGQNTTDNNENSLNKNMSNENEDQKVSKEHCISVSSSEELLHLRVAKGNFDAAYKEPYTWDPAFLYRTLLKEQNYNLQKEGGYFLSHEVIRVQPLKTCKGPIRIGLSRKARPKQLHPYLK